MTPRINRALQRTLLAAMFITLAPFAKADGTFSDPALDTDVRIIFRLPRFFGGEGLSIAFVRVRNTADYEFEGPLRFVFDTERTILNATGETADGKPVVNLCTFCSIRPNRSFSKILLVSGVSNSGLNASTEYTPYHMQLLHFADIDGVGPLANAKNFSGLVELLKGEYPSNTAFLSSGDNWIPGPAYAAGDAVFGAAGRGDMNILNAMGVQASAIGNHELDLGLDEFASLLAPAEDYDGATFPYLSTNIDFTGTSIPLIPNAQPAAPASVAGSTVIEVGGERIGIVGAASPTFPGITGTEGVPVLPPLIEGSFDINALAAEIQSAVDGLTSIGIDKVIVLAHMQSIFVEREFAPLLEDVDVIIGGGSNTIFADDNDFIRAGDSVGGDYPEVFTSPKGEPVLLVNTDGDYKYLGRLVSAFDPLGRIIPASLDDSVNGAYATDEAGLLATVGTVPPANAVVEATVDALEAQIAATEGNTFGFTNVYLDGRRATVRTQESNLGNLTADANLALAQAFDPTVLVSLKNGGGIRDDIGDVIVPPGGTEPVFLPPAEIPGIKPAGAISQFDIANTLRFNNGLVLLNVTAENLAALMENGFSRPDPVGIDQDGAFPQIAGMRATLDPTAPQGSRLVSLDIVDETDGSILDTVVAGGTVVGDPARVIRMISLDFLVGLVTGSAADGYPFPDLNDPATGLVELTEVGLDAGVATFEAAGSEQDALAEYLAANFGTPETAFDEAETPRAEDQRIIFLSDPVPSVE